MVVIVIMITATLIELNQQQGQKAVDQTSQIYRHLRLASVMLLQSIPLMIILFVLFPRVSSPLWGLPQDAYGSTTGLSNEMTPGDIGNLTQSERVAFRVDFDGPVPAKEQRYWRGPVFWYTDGRSWKPSSARDANLQEQLPVLMTSGEPFNYTVTLEAHQRKWLFALDLPVTKPESSRVTSDFQIHALQPVKQRLQYQLLSYTNYRMPTLSGVDRRRALQLPVVSNPQTRALGARLREEFQDDGRIIDAALGMFRSEEFFYTLQPPILGSANPIDEFLFDTRRGFCGHYSSAFTTIMRAAGIPARVVTGYQGGEINPVGGYMIVRQSDAHAWVEVWRDGLGWRRVDPTAAVAPQRIERNFADASVGEDGVVQFDLPESSAARELLRRVRLGWDSVNNSWNKWILNYDRGRQSQFLSELGLGIDSWKSTLIALTICMAVAMGLLTIVTIARQRHKTDPVERHWRKFCRILARKGLAREPYEGPRDYATRVITARPELADSVGGIVDSYVNLRYQPRHDEQQRRQFRQQVAAFRA